MPRVAQGRCLLDDGLREKRVAGPAGPAKAGPYGGTYERFTDASRNPSNSGRNSPVRQKFSGCHWTPRQKRADGSSIASITPSGAVAETRNRSASFFTAW